MPTIIVTSDSTENGPATVTMREHVAPGSLESEHYSAQLIERVGWAVVDAEESD